MPSTRRTTRRQAALSKDDERELSIQSTPKQPSPSSATEMQTPSTEHEGSNEFSTPSLNKNDDDMDFDLDMDIDLDELLNKASESLALKRVENGETKETAVKGYSVLEELKKWVVNLYILRSLFIY